MTNDCSPDCDRDYFIARIEEIEQECDSKQRCFAQILEHTYDMHIGMTDAEILDVRHRLRTTLLDGLGIKDIIA